MTRASEIQRVERGLKGGGRESEDCRREEGGYERSLHPE
jgi:hypothetical protein